MTKTVTGRTVGEQPEPLAVSPKTACALLGIKNTYLYELLARGELRSYKDGKARKITTESIRARIERLLAGDGATGTATESAPRRGRGRPRKNAGATVTP